MKKFLNVIALLAVISMLMATVGFLILPSKILAYVQNGNEVYISSFSVYTFAIVNMIISTASIFYLKRCMVRFKDEQYPTGVTVVAFCTLILSFALNFMTFLVLNMFLNRTGMPIPAYFIRIFFAMIGVLTGLYGLYISRAKLDSSLAIRNKWAMHNEMIYGFSNKFSSVVFYFGAVFIIILSWILPSLRQLYLMTLTVLLICGLSSVYISKTIYKKYNTMYREKVKNKK